MKRNVDKDDFFYHTVLDAIPIMVFIVDEDVRFIDFNTTAQAGFSLDRETALHHRGGDILQCLHSYDSPEGCGRGPVCKDCLIRNSVAESRKGNSVVRKRTKFELMKNGEKKELEIFVTANAMEFQGSLLTILVLEDVSEMLRLKRIIPICAKCKKIRNDDKYWQEVEEYINECTGLDFTHGLCPKCLREAYPAYRGEYDHLNG